MPLSQIDIIKSPDGIRELVEQGRDFNSLAYLTNFAPFLFTHLRGFRELMDILLLDPQYHSRGKVKAYIRAERFSVQPLIPQQWKQALSKRPHWGDCHGNQTDRICCGVPARLDQSLQAILALGILFAQSRIKVLRELDIYNYVRIVPANYALKIPDQSVAKWLRGDVTSDAGRKKWRELVAKLYGQDAQLTGAQLDLAKTFLADASREHPLTWQNANLILPYLKVGTAAPTVKFLGTRVDGGRHAKRPNETQMRCCDGEADFIRMDEAGVSSLESLKQSYSEAQAAR